MSGDDGRLPTVGQQNGEAVYGRGKGETEGSVEYGGASSADELLEVAGIKERKEMTRPLGQLGGEVAEEEVKTYEERVRERLPDDAELLSDGSLRVESSRRNKENHSFLNQNRRAILKKLEADLEPMDVEEELGFNNSFIYRTRAEFGFLLEDDLLKEAFIEDGGRYAPTYSPDEEKESEEPQGGELEEKVEEGEIGESEEEMDTEEEDTTTEEPEFATDEELSYGEYQEQLDNLAQGQAVEANTVADMMEAAYKAGERVGRNDAQEDNTDLFDGDEWWEIMKTLMDNGEEEYARRIASEIDFN